MIQSALRPAFRTAPWPLDRVPGVRGPFFERRTVLAGTVPAELPAGTYTFEAAFVRPNGDPRDPNAVITASIAVSVSVGGAPRAGTSAIRLSSALVGMATNPRTNTVGVARDPGILSLVSLATERVVFSTPVLDPEEPLLAQGLGWSGSLGAVAVNPVTYVAVVTNAQPIYARLASFTPYVTLVNLSTGDVLARLPLDPSPAIADLLGRTPQLPDI